MNPDSKCERCTFVPEIIREQLALLSDKSKAKDVSAFELAVLTQAMCELLNCLD